MSTWLSLGCSPTAPEGLAQAQADHEIHTTITTNAGVELLPVPDYIFSFDTISAAKYANQWNLLQARGTVLVTFGDYEQMMCTMGVNRFNVKLRRSFRDVIDFQATDFPSKGHSGMYATQFAAMQANRVILVGHDGYSPGKPDHWYDSCTTHWTDKKREDTLRQLYQPFYRRMAAVYPGVEFIQYGLPNFQVDAPNWRVMEVQDDSHGSDPRAGRISGNSR